MELPIQIWLAPKLTKLKKNHVWFVVHICMHSATKMENGNWKTDSVFLQQTNYKERKILFIILARMWFLSFFVPIGWTFRLKLSPCGKWQMLDFFRLVVFQHYSFWEHYAYYSGALGQILECIVDSQRVLGHRPIRVCRIWNENPQYVPLLYVAWQTRYSSSRQAVFSESFPTIIDVRVEEPQISILGTLSFPQNTVCNLLL